MSFAIQASVNPLSAQENLRVTSNFQSRTIRRLTSGSRAASNGDDAAGTAIANAFRSDVAELTQGVRNANDGVSALQIMDSGLTNIVNMLGRQRSLATAAASDTFTGDRSQLDEEFQRLTGEIDRQAQSIGLSQGGTYARKLSVSLGGTATATGVEVDLSGSSVDARTLGLRTVDDQAIGISSAAGAATVLQTIERAVAALSGARTAVGKGQNDLAFALGQAQSRLASFGAAESRIHDAYGAMDSAGLTKAAVLQQSSIAAMAQANSAPQAVLALLSE